MHNFAVNDPVAAAITPFAVRALTPAAAACDTVGIMPVATPIQKTKRTLADAPRELSTEELMALFRKLPETTDPAEKESLRLQIFEGWYGRRFTKQELDEAAAQARQMFPQEVYA